MKNPLLFTLSGLIFALGVLVFAGCNKDEQEPSADEPSRLESNLLMGKTLFANTLDNRGAHNIFEILDVERNGDALDVRVKGGHDGDAFQFIWDGQVQESYPMGIRLILVCDDADGAFDKDKEFLISLNLQKIIGERHNVEEYHFIVINGSKIQTSTLDPNGKVTTEHK